MSAVSQRPRCASGGGLPSTDRFDTKKKRLPSGAMCGSMLPIAGSAEKSATSGSVHAPSTSRETRMATTGPAWIEK